MKKGPVPVAPEIRFWRFVEPIPEGQGCWEWTGAIRRGPFHYGKLSVSRSKWTSAHRISWLIHFGPVPRGLSVLHKCDNPSCVNPKHLFLGTQRDNVADMFQKGRANVMPGVIAGAQARRLHA